MPNICAVPLHMKHPLFSLAVVSVIILMLRLPLNWNVFFSLFRSYYIVKKKYLQIEHLEHLSLYIQTYRQNYCCSFTFSIPYVKIPISLCVTLYDCGDNTGYKFWFVQTILAISNHFKHLRVAAIISNLIFVK